MRYVKKLDKTRVIVGYFKISSNKNIKRYHQRQLSIHLINNVRE